MKRFRMSVVILIVVVSAAFSMMLFSSDMPFGGKEDVSFANATWAAMTGYEGWLMKSDYIPGTSPHGKVVRLYYNMVSVNDKPYHVIVKDNFNGDGISVDAVKKSPEKKTERFSLTEK